MHNNYAIGIPTINRADLLIPTLHKYAIDFPTIAIYVLDNGKQDIPIEKWPNVTIFYPPDFANLGVAGSWNALCRLIFYEEQGLMPSVSMGNWKRYPGRPLAWIMNDDIYSGMCEKGLELHLFTTPLFDFAAPEQNWSNFMITETCFQKVGPFDEKFYPAYYEDNDYRYRLKLKGLTYRQLPWLAPEVFRVSMSREKDPSLCQRVPANLEYYVAKWGGPPGEETYRIPFDGELGGFG